MTNLNGWSALIIGAVVFLSTNSAQSAEKLSVLIVDGQNNHNWKQTTPYLESFLEGTERFTVDVVTTPEKGAAEQAWSDFDPQFQNYDLVLSNYNGEPWPRSVEENFEAYVAGGGGVVVVHAANNPFPNWAEWNKMIGLGWRKANYGDRIAVNDDGETVRTAAKDGPGAGHGPQHPYPVVIRDRAHPVMKGMPAEWMHPKDELYHGQRGPAMNMNLLATAYSSPDQRGTGAHEPMVWWIPYGDGVVFTCLLGHVGGRSDDLTAMQCVGFRTIVARGCEWVATGEVTFPVPDNFPTPEQTSVETGAE